MKAFLSARRWLVGRAVRESVLWFEFNRRFEMLRKMLLATALVAALAVPALLPQEANAQVVIRGPRFGVGIGTPYYGGYYGGYRPYYYGYPTYGYVNRGYYGYGGFSGARYYGRSWR
jgi:hypothetical protein